MRRYKTIFLGILLAVSGCKKPVLISLVDASGDTDAGLSSIDGTLADSGQNVIDAQPEADGHIHTDMDADTTVDANTVGDPCVASMANAASTVGCNGFLTSEPAPNEAGGTCTQGGEVNPQGSCTDATAVCAGFEGETQGTCIPACPPTTTYVSNGGCPTGFRCFNATEEYGICFRDCDDAHACPTGQNCDEEGSCVGDFEGEEEDI